MAVESNGKAVEPGHKGMNGHAVTAKSKVVKKQKGFSLFSVISRLMTWYSIITILFRCPSAVDLLTDSSPKICKPYFQVRSTVIPHLEPYYDAYAAPYVDAARPYYNAVEKRVITPATALGLKYGAPRIAQAQSFGQSQWKRTVQPHVSNYQGKVKAKYDEILAPHMDKAYTVAGPYYEIARTSALQTYYEHVLPTYTAVQPYAQQGYGMASDFAVNTAFPYSRWMYTTVGVFLDRTVFPKLRILYGENVEPQLVRIGERLGRYRDGKRMQAVVDEIESASSASSASQSFSSVSSSISSAHATTSTASSSANASSTSSEVPASTPLSAAEIREKAVQVVANDLKTWQEKFSKAADEGSEDLDERITEITDRLVANQAEKVGTALNIQLEETIKSSFKTLKSKIISIIENSNDNDISEDELSTAVRRAGVAIKEKGQAVRTWRQNYDKETNFLVSKAAEDTLEILDHIQDLGLQEIGMRWAWTDGITHKDWTKYHQLKPKFDEWRHEVEQVAINHAGLEKARAASEEVENQAMGIAEEAARELARLKETGRWKISTGDTSDDWNTKVMPAPAAVAGQKVVSKLSDASEVLVGTSTPQGSVESVVSVGSNSVSSLVDQASSSIIGTQQGSPESATSVAKVSASSILDKASSSIIGTQQGSAESASSVAKESASSIVDKASSSIIGTSPGIVESLISVASESASSLTDKASSSVIGTEPAFVQKASSSIESAVSGVSKSVSDGSSYLNSLSSSASSSISKSASHASSSISSSGSSMSSTASRKVWGGAVAQFVEARQIIYEDVIEDDDTYSEKIQILASEAGDRFADITKAVSEALLRPTSTQGTVESVTSLAAEQYSSALVAASLALYGPEQGSGESIASVVSSRYSDAVSAASNAIYGTPAPMSESIAAHLNDAVEAASSQYQAALSAGSTAVYGTPLSPQQSLHSAASSVQEAFESMSSVASSNLLKGLGAASAHFADAKSYVGAVQTDDASKQKLLDQMQNQYYAGVGMAHDRYSEFLSAASSAVMPTPTPFHESVASQASENWEALITKASSQVYGAPTPYFVTRRLLSEAKEYADAATSGVVSQYSAMQSLISDLVSGKEPDFTESVYNRFSSAYYTGAGEAVSSASSYVSEVYESASSVVSSVFTPPPTLETILNSASSRVNDAVELASIQFYGTSTAYVEAAQSSASSIYSSVQSVASEKIYGSQVGYGEAAQSSIADAASSAQQAISEAIYGTATGTIESATSYAGDKYVSASSAISSAVWGAEQGAVESAQARLSAAVESARVKLAEFAAAAGDGASEAVRKASEGVEEFASSVSSAVESATSHVKDEL